MTLVQREWQRLLKSPIARNAGWVLAGQGAGVVLQGTYFILLARLLGATEYGIYGGAFALSAIVAQYSPLGTGTLFLRYVSGEPEAFSVYWGNLLVVTLGMGSILTIALTFLGPKLLNAKSAELVLMAAIANCLCTQLTSETAKVFQAFDNLKIFALLSLLTNLFRTLTAGAMLLTLHRATAWQWTAASTVVSAVSVVAAVATVSVRLGRPTFSQGLFRRRAVEGMGYSFAASTTTVYNDFDKTLLSHYGMNLANGVYTMAYRVIDIATLPISSMQGAAVPELFRRGRDGVGATMQLTNQLLKRGVVMGALASIVLVLTAPIIPHIVGMQFAECVIVLRWLCLIPLFRGMHLLTGGALTAAGHQKYRTLTQATVSGVNLLLNLWLIPRFSWLGAAWSSLATDGLLVVLNWGALQLVLRRSYAKA